MDVVSDWHDQVRPYVLANGVRWFAGRDPNGESPEAATQIASGSSSSVSNALRRDLIEPLTPDCAQTARWTATGV